MLLILCSAQLSCIELYILATIGCGFDFFSLKNLRFEVGPGRYREKKAFTLFRVKLQDSLAVVCRSWIPTSFYRNPGVGKLWLVGQSGSEWCLPFQRFGKKETHFICKAWNIFKICPFTEKVYSHPILSWSSLKKVSSSEISWGLFVLVVCSTGLVKCKKCYLKSPFCFQFPLYKVSFSYISGSVRAIQ